MEGLADQVLGKKKRAPRWWIAVTLVAGAIGALGAVSSFGGGTYTITPLRVELSAKAALQGSTQLSVRPLPGIQPAHAEAGTHQSPMTVRMTVVGVDAKALVKHPTLFANPFNLASYIREEGKDAFKDFATRLIMLAISGGAAGGLVVSFGRWKRIAGGALAGVLVLGIIGGLLYATYDVGEFRNTKFVLDRGGVAPSGGLIRGPVGGPVGGLPHL